MVHEFQQSGCLCAAKRTGCPGLIHCERHFSSRLPPSGGTWKYAKVPSTKKTWTDSLPIDMLLSAVSVLVVAQSSSEFLEGLMNKPVLNRIVHLVGLIYEMKSLIEEILNLCMKVYVSLMWILVQTEEN